MKKKRHQIDLHVIPSVTALQVEGSHLVYPFNLH